MKHIFPSLMQLLFVFNAFNYSKGKKNLHKHLNAQNFSIFGVIYLEWIPEMRLFMLTIGTAFETTFGLGDISNPSANTMHSFPVQLARRDISFS